METIKLKPKVDNNVDEHKKHKEQFLNDTITVYNLDEYIKKETDSIEKSFWFKEIAIFIGPRKSGIFLDYEAIGKVFGSESDSIEFDVVTNDEDGFIYMQPTGTIKLRIIDIMSEAPSKEVKAKDFFSKCLGSNWRCYDNLEDAINQLEFMRYFDKQRVDASLQMTEEFRTPDNEELKPLEDKFIELGFEIKHKGKTWNDSIHYQLVTKEGNKTVEDFDKMSEQMDVILDEFEDNTGSPCTFNLGLSDDGFISCGVDCRKIYYKPGEDTIYNKPTTLSFRNGKPADKYTELQLKGIANKFNMDTDDLLNSLPLDKPKNESLKVGDKVEINLPDNKNWNGKKGFVTWIDIHDKTDFQTITVSFEDSPSQNFDKKNVKPINEKLNKDDLRNKINKILEDNRTENSDIHLFEADDFPFEIKEGDSSDYALFWITGGLNGSGKWEDYLKDLTDLFKGIEQGTGYEPYVVKEDTDCPDDVFNVQVGLRIEHKNESLNESLKILKEKCSKKDIGKKVITNDKCKNYPVGRKGIITDFSMGYASYNTDATYEIEFENGLKDTLYCFEVDFIDGLNEKAEKHDTLNPKLWNEDKTLKPEVENKINEIVSKFLDGLKEDEIKINVKDIKLVGSNCSYNYNDKSDLDIHIEADTDSLGCPDNLYPLLYSAYRSIWNKNHDIDFYGIPVELFIETSDTQKQPVDPVESELKENYIQANKPYMLRNDGEVFECGTVHPYVIMYPSSSFETNYNEFKKHPQWIEWIKEHSKSEEVIRLMAKHETMGLDEPDLKKLNDAFNKEFCRFRTSNFKYKTGGDNGEIYFRPSSEGFNWFNLIWNVVAHNSNWIKNVTIVKDGQTFGKEFDYYILDGKKMSHLPTEEFLTLKGNPVVEKLTRLYVKSDDLSSNALDILKSKYEIVDDTTKPVLVHNLIKDGKKFEILDYGFTNDGVFMVINESLQEERQQTALKSNGIYSVMNDNWIKEPVQADIPEVDQEAFDKLFKEWEDKYKELIKDPTVEKIEKFIEDIYDLRKTSIAKDGEYSLGNLVFKEMRNLDYLDKLKQLKNELVTKELSLK